MNAPKKPNKQNKIKKNILLFIILIQSRLIKNAIIKELKVIKRISSINRGIKNKRIIILPMKLIKKLTPKIGTINSRISEYVIRLLFVFRKVFIIYIFNFFFYLLETY